MKTNRIIFKHPLFFIILTLGVGLLIADIDDTIIELTQSNFVKGSWTLFLVLGLLYILLLCCPFVPGAELGLLLMIVSGPVGALCVYLMTLLALSISFALGVRLKHQCRNHASISARIEKDSVLAKRLNKTQMSQAPLKSCLLLAGLLNTPGNSVIGGGAGIAMFYGYNQKLAWPRFLLTISTSVLPVPLFYFLAKSC